MNFSRNQSAESNTFQSSSHNVQPQGINAPPPCLPISLYERLENVRIDSQEMIENMNKLGQFFGKYGKDKRVKIQEGWLRIKEESINMLQKRTALIEEKLKLVCSSYEDIFEELSVAKEELGMKLEVWNKNKLEIDKEIDILQKREEENLSAIRIAKEHGEKMKRGWQLNIDQVEMRVRVQNEKVLEQNQLKAQLEQMQMEFHSKTEEIDSILENARDKQKGRSIKAKCVEELQNHVDQHSFSMTMPPLFDKISPINKGNAKNNMKPLAILLKNKQDQSSHNSKHPQSNIQHKSESILESFESGFSSHMSTSKNEGRWESGLESPSGARAQDSQSQLKKAILFFSENIDLLQILKNKSEEERQGHLELLLHHVENEVRQIQDSEVIKSKGVEMDHSQKTPCELLQMNSLAFKKKVPGKDTFLQSLLGEQMKNSNIEDKGNQAAKNNSILDLVQSDEMSFSSRLPPLTNRSDQSEQEPEFKNHVKQEDLLKVKPRDDQMYFIQEEEEIHHNSSSSGTSGCRTNNNYLFSNDQEELLQHAQAKIDCGQLDKSPTSNGLLEFKK